jgi:hypothetical protein
LTNLYELGYEIGINLKKNEKITKLKVHNLILKNKIEKTIIKKKTYKKIKVKLDYFSNPYETEIII